MKTALDIFSAWIYSADGSASTDMTLDEGIMMNGKMSYQGFIQALTEHDNEIKQLIDDMKDGINRDLESDFIYTWEEKCKMVAKVEALTELKEKLK